MTAYQPENEMNDPFDDLFGKPSLLEGEDEERYERLRAAVIRDLKTNQLIPAFHMTGCSQFG